MATRKKLLLYVEGEGDKGAVPVLLKRLLTDLDAWQYLTVPPALPVQNIGKVLQKNCQNWIGWLQAAACGPDFGGALLLLDGDTKSFQREIFCPGVFARRIAERARQAGAGATFSVACVFACMEFESWILACADRLAGLTLPDGRPGIRAGTSRLEGNLEEAPRNAKGRLGELIDAGYQAPRDQEQLTRLMVNHLDTVRERGLRSFQQLEKALSQIVEAFKTSTHIVSPSPPSE